MIYYKTSNGRAREIKPKFLLILLAWILIGYPLGGVCLLNSAGGPGLQPFEGIGLLLLALALIGAAIILPSSLQRISADETGGLDERELKLRASAFSFSFRAFGALTLLAIVYCGIATDAGWWTPTAFDEWNAIFWGGVLYATFLPTLYLAWTAPPDMPEPS